MGLRTALLVVGMHRSGTSAVARTLSLMGAALPGNLLASGSEENERGFWESSEIIAIHDGFLAAVGSRWDDPRPLPEAAFTDAAARMCLERLVAVLARDFAGVSRFVVKDPRMCRLLPLWHSAAEAVGARPVAVLPVRTPLAVARSLQRRNGFAIEAGLALWLSHVLSAERATRGWRRHFLNYDSFVADPIAAAVRLAAGAGCFSAVEVQAALPAVGEHWTADLRHHRPTEADPALPAPESEAWSWLERVCVEGGEPDGDTFDALYDALARAGATPPPADKGTLPAPRWAPRWREALWLLPYLRRGLFDAAYYRANVPGAARWPLLHYLLIGRTRGAGPNALFDPAWYTSRHPDVRASGVDPLVDFLRRDGAEFRPPSPLFDGGFYLARNPDVAAHGMNPLCHYLAHGWRECRDPNPLFDTAYYRSAGDVPSEPVGHYLAAGAAEGRRPSPLFDGGRYRADNVDVAGDGVDPLVHYLDRGMAEGRCRARIVLVLHDLGGGIERHCDDLEVLLTAEAVDVWRLQSTRAGPWRMINRTRGIEREHGDEAGLLADLRGLRPELVHVHHFIGFGRRLWRWLSELGAPYDVTLHDYAFVCPRVNLLDGDGGFCGQPDDPTVCDRCLGAAGAHPCLESTFAASPTISDWRAWASAALAGARRVLVPDEDVAERHRRHWPHLRPLLRRHPEPMARIPVRPPVDGGRIRIAVIGSLHPHKGSHVLLACARSAQEAGLPLTFVVIGDVSEPEAFASLGTVETTGRYRDGELSRRIDSAACHAAAFFSIWPETHLYTLSAALRAGLYPVVFDIGAPARRVRELGWGTVLPVGLDAEGINRALMAAALDHPLPDGAVGQVYRSMLGDYLGGGPRPT